MASESTTKETVSDNDKINVLYRGLTDEYTPCVQVQKLIPTQLGWKEVVKGLRNFELDQLARRVEAKGQSVMIQALKKKSPQQNKQRSKNDDICRYWKDWGSARTGPTVGSSTWRLQHRTGVETAKLK